MFRLERRASHENAVRCSVRWECTLEASTKQSRCGGNSRPATRRGACFSTSRGCDLFVKHRGAIRQVPVVLLGTSVHFPANLADAKSASGVAKRNGSIVRRHISISVDEIRGSVVADNAKIRSGRDHARIANERWHAVSVVGGAVPCPAATELRTKRFLPQEAPRLPVLNCGWPMKCACVYRHYADRRATPRRASERGQPWRTVVPERRHVHGRRVDD